MEKERRNPPPTQPVQDTSAEQGIKINNIIQSLVLGVMAWVGININTMKDDISGIRETTKVNAVEIINLKYQLNEHLRRHGNKE